MNRFALVACFWLGTSMGGDGKAGAEPGPAEPRQEARQWKSEQGLPSNAVETLLQSRDGWLWVGTRQGLARFDGVTFTRYSASERGFTDDAVIALGEDEGGQVWAGTKQGLFGLQPGGFRRPPELEALPAQSVRRLVAASSGGLWVVTTRAVSRLRWGRWTHLEFGPEEGRGWKGGEPPQLFDLGEDRSGTIWVASDAGLYSRDAAGTGWVRHWHRPPPKEGEIGQDHIVRAVRVAKGGVVWFATDRLLGRRGPDGTVEEFAIPASAGDERVRRVVEVDGVIELVAGGRLYRMDGRAVVPSLSWPGEEEAFVTDTLVMADGSRWLATRYGGVAQLSRPRVAVFTTRDGLPHNNVFSVCAAREGGVWVATGGGVAHGRPGRFEVVSVPGAGVRQPWHAVLEDREGDLWLAANPMGVSWLTHPTNNPTAEAPSGARFVPGFIEHDLEDRASFPVRAARVRVMAEDAQGRVWLGQAPGLFMALPGEQWVHFERGHRLAGQTVRSRRPFRWYAGDESQCETDWGFFRRNGEWIPRLHARWWPGPAAAGPAAVPPVEEHPLFPWAFADANRPIRSMLVDRRQRLWLGTLDGLICVDGGAVRRWTVREGLAGDEVESLHESRDGAIWAGTRSGLCRWNGRSWTILGAACGLEETMFYQIMEDGHGALWFGGQQGITRVARAELEAVAAGQARRVTALRLGEADGMLNGETMGGSHPSAARTADGRLWFATGQGLAMVDPAVVHTPRPGPPVFLERLATGDRVLDLWPSAEWMRPGRPLVLRPGSGRRLELHYTALHYAAPDRLRFEYALSGHDDHAVSVGTRRAAFFTNLRPGDYRFRVRAANPDGQWSPQWAELGFRIQPYLHETWWVRTLVLAGLVAGVILLVRWRSRELRRFAVIERENRLREERERLARDLHDDVAANLTLITMLAPEGSSGEGSKPPGGELSRATALADAALDNLGELVWATNPRFDTLDNLAAYLRELVHRLLAKTRLQPVILFPAAIPPLPVSGEIRRHSVLIVKEALHNILKHGQAREVRVEIRLPDLAESRTMVIVVADDGVGGASESPGGAGSIGSRGNGLMNMRHRAAQMGGTLTVESPPGVGTRVTLVLPLREPSWPESSA